MSPFDFLKLILGVWYISFALTSTHGPGGVFEWMREHLWHGRTKVQVPVSIDGKPYTKWEPGQNGLLDCIICFAPYVALGLLLLDVQAVRDVLALAGGALLLHSFTGWRFGE